jgi:hypothetical protein
MRRCVTGDAPGQKKQRWGLPPTKVSAGFPRIVQLTSFQVVVPECGFRGG